MANLVAQYLKQIWKTDRKIERKRDWATAMMKQATGKKMTNPFVMSLSICDSDTILAIDNGECNKRMAQYLKEKQKKDRWIETIR